MWTLFKTVLGTVLEALFGSLWNRFFPPKTVADQKVADLTKTVKEAEQANEDADKIHAMSDAQLDADLAKRMRD